MSKAEVSSLKAREKEAFQAKQLAWENYQAAKIRASEAHEVMESAWDKRVFAREEMNREFEEMRGTSERYSEVWAEYARIRDTNGAEIERLRADADYEHQEMQDCFERANDCYENGDKSEAPYWSSQGHDHKERRNELNAEVGALKQEIRDAKANAEWRAPKTDSSAYQRAKGVFEQAKTCHEYAQAEFKRLKAERDRLKEIFDSLQEEHTRLKEEVRRKSEERSGWDGPHRGVILGKNRDYEVTFSQGTGRNSGQTVIADGHLSKRQFHTKHNHYGKNDKNRFPNEPDFIEDSSAHKNDDFYHGPGY